MTSGSSQMSHDLSMRSSPPRDPYLELDADGYGVAVLMPGDEGVGVASLAAVVARPVGFRCLGWRHNRCQFLERVSSSP